MITNKFGLTIILLIASLLTTLSAQPSKQLLFATDVTRSITHHNRYRIRMDTVYKLWLTIHPVSVSDGMMQYYASSHFLSNDRKTIVEPGRIRKISVSLLPEVSLQTILMPIIIAVQNGKTYRTEENPADWFTTAELDNWRALGYNVWKPEIIRTSSQYK